MSSIITLFDTSYSSLNIGDNIIMASINEILEDIIDNPKVYIYRVSTHLRLSKEAKIMINESSLKILCGTNLFHLGYMPLIKFNPWEIGIRDLPIIKGTVLLGVGTSIFNNKSLASKMKILIKNSYSKFMWREILMNDNNLWHSVRDQESLSILKELGFNNVLNTGCPTLWRLDSAHCAQIPTKKANNAVMTFRFTDHKEEEENDLFLLRTVAENYEYVSRVGHPAPPKMDSLGGENGHPAAAKLDICGAMFGH